MTLSEHTQAPDGSDSAGNGDVVESSAGQGAVRHPSDVSGRVGFFDRFAGRTAQFASKAPFFAFCVLLVVIWAPSYFLLGDIDTWQLIINTATTIITFLMVALLQNTQTRNDMATQDKLNAIADGLADLMRYVGGGDPEVARDVDELRAAVGLEERETTSSR